MEVPSAHTALLCMLSANKCDYSLMKMELRLEENN